MKISGYEQLTKIGEGEQGLMFVGVNQALQRKHAIKVLKNKEMNMKRFTREIEILKDFEENGVVPIYSAGQTDTGNPYYSMKYIEGSSLKDELQKGVYSPQQYAQVIHDVCDILSHMHEQGVVHRDIKPSSILIDTQNNIYLSNFGFAKKQGNKRLTKTGSLIGTAHYMSPEQVKGKQATEQSDIYALGVILYEALTGRTPHIGELESELFMNIIQQPIKRPTNLNKEADKSLEAICMKALEKKLEKRYQIVEDMAEQLQIFTEGYEVDERSYVRKVVDACREHSKLVMGGALIIGIIGSGLYSLYKEEYTLQQLYQKNKELKQEVVGITKKKQHEIQLTKSSMELVKTIQELEQYVIVPELADRDKIAVFVSDEQIKSSKDIRYYVAGLASRNVGYKAKSFEEYFKYLQDVQSYFYKAFLESNNNMWYLALTAEYTYFSHLVGEGSLKKVADHLCVHEDGIYPKDLHELLQKIGTNESKADMSKNPQEAKKYITKALEGCKELLAYEQAYMMRYHIYSHVIKEQFNVQQDLSSVSQKEDVQIISKYIDVLLKAHEQYPDSLQLLYEISHYYELYAKKTLRNEFLLTSIRYAKRATEINPYHLSSLYRITSAYNELFEETGDKKYLVEGKKYFVRYQEVKPEETYVDSFTFKMGYEIALHEGNKEEMIKYINVIQEKKRRDYTKKIIRGNHIPNTTADEYYLTESVKILGKYDVKKLEALIELKRYDEAREQCQETIHKYTRYKALGVEREKYKHLINVVLNRLERTSKNIAHK